MSANHVKRKRATSSNEDPASKNAPNEPELGSDDVSETETHESSSSEYSDSEAEGEQVPAKRVKTAEEEEKNRKSRAEQKTLLQERKLAKPKAPLIQQAKKIWERLRQKELKREERRQLMEELMPLLRGNVKDIIFKHDASRVVQCAVKYGSSSQRDELAEELKGSYVELSKSLYGRFLISKILKYCSAVYRHAVIQDFYGKVRRMIRHKDASMVLEEAYSQYANSQQRAALLEEFYGPEFALFKHAGGHSLQDLLKENPHKKPAIMRHLRETLISILGKGFTSIGHLTIVHKALLEYFTYAEEKQLVEMMEFVKEHLVSILHTREGARVAQLCITHAGPKDRKIIIKSMKDYVRKVAMEQYGHAVLLSIFECVDDTVLVDKAILCELTRDGLTAGERFSDILKDRYGGRVVLYLLCGRNRKYQPQYVIDELRDLDVIRAKTSKKDDSTRHQQLLKAISPALLTSLTENCEELIRDDNGSAVLKEAFFVAEGDKEPLVKAIAAVTADTTVKTSRSTHTTFNAVQSLHEDAARERQKEEGIDLSEHALVNRRATATLKYLIAPHERTADGHASRTGNAALIDAIAESISPNIEFWLRHCAEDPRRTSGTGYVLLNIVDSEVPSARRKIVDAVKHNSGLIEEISSTMRKNLAMSSTSHDPLPHKRRKVPKKDLANGKDTNGKTALELLIEQCIRMS